MTGVGVAKSPCIQKPPDTESGMSALEVSGAAAETSERATCWQRTCSVLTLGGIRQSTITLMATAIGGGVLAVPVAVKNAGAGMAFVVAAFTGVAAHVSMVLCMDMCQKCGVHSYGELFAKVAGSKAEPILDFMMAIFGTGVATAYFIFLGDFLGDVFKSLKDSGVPEFLLNDGDYDGRTNVILMIFGLTFPLVLLRDLSSLRFLAPTSTCALMYTATLLICYAPFLFNENVGQPDYGDVKMTCDSVGDFLESFSLFLFSYNCHLNVIPVADKLVRPTKARITKVCWRVNFVQYLLYSAIGYAGYLSHLHKTPSNILNAYPTDNHLFTLSRVLLSCGVMVGIPLNLHPAVGAWVSFIRWMRGGEAGPATENREMILRCVIAPLSLMACSWLAINVPDVKQVITFLSGTIGTSMMLLIPAYAAFMLLEPTTKNRAKIAVLLLCAVLCFMPIPMQAISAFAPTVPEEAVIMEGTMIQ